MYVYTVPVVCNTILLLFKCKYCMYTCIRQQMHVYICRKLQNGLKVIICSCCNYFLLFFAGCVHTLAVSFTDLLFQSSISY